MPSTGETTWEILQLWYKEAYEKVCLYLQQEEKKSAFWEDRYKNMARSRDYLRHSNRVLVARVTAMEEYIEQKHRLIDEIFNGFPEVQRAYQLAHENAPSDEDTEELPTRRRLEF